MTWSVTDCDDYSVGPAGPYEGDSRVIFSVHWECVKGVDLPDGTRQEAAARVYGSTDLEPFSGGDFLPWASVTESEVLAWLHAKMGADEVARIEAQVNADANALEHPTTGHGLPWGG